MALAKVLGHADHDRFTKLQQMYVDIVADFCWDFEEGHYTRVLRVGVDFGDRNRNPGCPTSVLLT